VQGAPERFKAQAASDAGAVGCLSFAQPTPR